MVMKQGYKDIVWFNEVGKWDIGAVGGKGANLGKMSGAEARFKRHRNAKVR